MTNNWTDIGNSTLVVVMGANPTENHPACVAHINNARRGPGTYHDRAGNAYTSGKEAAKLVVIDPRKTRTATIADMYVRIRPGTDIAFINGLVNYIIDARGIGTGLNAPAHAGKKARWEAYHGAESGKSHFPQTGAAVSITRPKYTDSRFVVNGTNEDYARSTQTIGANTFDNLPEVAPSMYDSGTVFAKLKAHVAPYTPDVVADICGCTAAQLIAVAELYIEHSRCNSVASDADPFAATINDPKEAGYKSATMLYAMGLTQHTVGSQNVKSFAVLQTLLGNMGRSGGGINALRGIHNVQGSTDMGLLYHLIPGYSGNPGGTFASYMNGLYGNRLDATTAYGFAAGGLQQKGFWSMTKAFFGDTSYRLAFPAGYEETLSAIPENQDSMDKLFALWPKGNGDNHIRMFRKMAAGTIKAAVAWGQNPAVTEPNQSFVRDGLKELDLLVCVDMFENETAACDRKADSVTYLIPASSHVEEAGSATNSGRVLQWRFEAAKPMGNTKSDLELVMRFAYALETAGSFAHIKNGWSAITGMSGTANAYDVLWGSQYGWAGPGNAFDSEAVARAVYKQMCAPQNNGGTLWIYLDAWDTNTGSRSGGWPDATGIGGDGLPLGTAYPIRAKARVLSDHDAIVGNTGTGGRHMYKNWGYAWLINRRVLYSNGDTPWDVSDGFQGPDLVARLFVSTNANVIDYSTAYRTIHRLADKPMLPGGAAPTGAALGGRFPWHCEPYESPRPDLANVWGYNSTTNAANNAPGEGNLLYSGSARGVVGDFPLVLTSIRCVEHFQGGPITRNNAWNVEVEPEPWVEINSADARKYGIADGDWVNVITARSNSTSDQLGRSTTYAPTGGVTDNFGKGFRARVGVGLEGNQRTGVGVVAIPWHWGEQGLSTGARANDLCIDAMDANTTIPEYKACLCKIEKA